ncbi:MAG: tetratricopeptide repeat protein [Candidatus Omnitrophica bacterium]|nr:tetratricopeptide repeat protein [Candidatus Omnitrophota bacterium]
MIRRADKRNKVQYSAGSILFVMLLSNSLIFAADKPAGETEMKLLSKAKLANVFGDYDKAIAALDQAIKIKPDYAQAYFERGSAYYNKNPKELANKAIQDFDMAIKLNPDYAAAYSSRGNVKTALGQFDANIEDQNKALSLDPHNPSIYFNRAAAYSEKKMYSQAIADYNSSLKIKPDDADVFNGRGKVYLMKGDYDAAIKDLTRSIELDPQQAHLYSHFIRSKAYKKKGQIKEALADMKKAVELYPQHPELKEILAELEKEAEKEQELETPAQGGPMPMETRTMAKAISEPIVSPAQRASYEQGKPALGMFKGYAVANICGGEQETKASIFPWQSNAGGNVPLDPPQIGQYQAMLRHTMQDLRLLYGDLSSEDEVRFNKFWAPYFDHPTQPAYTYFQRIAPLLDEMIVTLSHLNGMLPGIGEALETTLVSGLNPASANARVAEVHFKRAKAMRFHLDELTQKVEALGNPPDPTAALCAAHARHHKIVAKLFKKEPVKAAPMEEDDEAFKRDIYKMQKSVNHMMANAAEQSRIDEKHKKEFFAYMNKLSNSANCTSSVANGQMSEADCEAIEARVKAQIDDLWKIGPNAWKGGSTPDSSAAPSTPSADNQPPAENQPQPQASHVEPENDPQLNAQAIAEHLALAEQIRHEADRWVEDASKEKDDKRRTELQKRAEAMYANAQAEKDIAESLQTGAFVHTRTEWDDHQQKALVGSIKKELAVFDIEHKMIVNTPKVADMLAGVEGLKEREALQQKIEEAINSPDRLRKLAEVYTNLQNKVIEQGQNQIDHEFDKVAVWDNRIAVAEKVEMAAGLGITMGALWAPAEIGSLALGYAGTTGFAEDGVKGATKNVARGVSSKLDVIISAYEGATKIDPATGQPGGAWGAMEGALWSIGTNKAFEVIGGKIQKAKAEYALSRQAEGGRGFAAVSRAGEGRLKEYDFKTPEERYKAELESAKTPDEQNAVKNKYEIQVKREAMTNEMEAARQKAEDSIRQGKDPNQAKEDYNKDLQDINGKYSESKERNNEIEAARQKAEDSIRQGADPDKTKEQYNKEVQDINDKYPNSEKRNEEHLSVMEELKFNAKEPTHEEKAQGIDNRDIKPTGSNPKNAASDMDFAPNGATPHEAYQKGKSYVEAMKKRGHSIDEYGDRWVDNTNDTTLWKPGFGADNPASSSFQAEVIFGTMPHSDKFGTQGGIEWTTSATHTTDDPLGAVLANAGKAAAAGLGNTHPKDLHTIGKSAVKALEAADIKIKDVELKSQIKGLKDHLTPEQAGIYNLGDDQATKDKKVKEFLYKVQSLMGMAYNAAKVKSEKSFEKFEPNPKDTSEGANKIRAKLKAYQAGNEAAIETISQASPGLAGQMGQPSKTSDFIPQGVDLDMAGDNIGGLSRALNEDWDTDNSLPTVTFDNNDPAFAGLGERCKQAAALVSKQIASAIPFSDESKYLNELKKALEKGASDPAEAIREIRALSGTELPVVLAELGVAGTK